MTLIPLLSAIIATPEATTAPAPAGASPQRHGYDPGAGHRPLAAAIAIGLPAVLVIAVALSPMIVPTAPHIASEPWQSLSIEKPKLVEPPTDVTEEAPTHTKTVTETVDPRIETTLPTDNVADRGPTVVDEVWNHHGPTVVPDPPAPSLVLAKLDPRYAGSFQPDYPANEQRREVEGMVKVRILIGTDGRVKAVELVSTDSPGFFEETKRRALSKWRFQPATRGGVPEESWQQMTVRFQIRNG